MKKLLLTSVIMLVAATLVAQKIEFKRVINKDFAVSADAFLKVTHKFGNVKIIEGSEGKIVFKIEITAKGKTADHARKITEDIKVDFKHANNTVVAEEFQAGNCSDCARTINYTITVPPSTTMNFDIKHGNLRMDETQKPLSVLMQFGNVNANTVKEASIDIKHGNVSINRCDKLKYESMFGSLKSEYIGSAIIETKHGNCDVEEVTDLKINSMFSNINIGNLTNSYTGEIAHGNLRIKNISAGFSTIAVNGQFSNLTLDLNESHSFTADLAATHGNIKCNAVKLTPSVHKNNRTALRGIAGKSSNPKAEVKLLVEHGNINFK